MPTLAVGPAGVRGCAVRTPSLVHVPSLLGRCSIRHALTVGSAGVRGCAARTPSLVHAPSLLGRCYACHAVATGAAGQRGSATRARYRSHAPGLLSMCYLCHAVATCSVRVWGGAALHARLGSCSHPACSLSAPKPIRAERQARKRVADDINSDAHCVRLASRIRTHAMLTVRAAVPTLSAA